MRQSKIGVRSLQQCIFREALLRDVKAVILVHYHPSGDTEPSQAKMICSHKQTSGRHSMSMTASTQTCAQASECDTIINTTEFMDRLHHMLLPELVHTILNQYRLPWRGVHGITHWARVLENGLRLTPSTGARTHVVALFAVFHDSQRSNESHDPGHGRRGAQFANSLRGKAFHLSDEDFALLETACAHHTDRLTAGDITVQTCWDADRLDLRRVGIVPDPRYLCTDPAKAPELLNWAFERSRLQYEPEICQDWCVTERKVLQKFRIAYRGDG